MTIINEHMQIEQLKAGNVSAFKVLYDLYAQRLYSFVYARTGTRVDAEDIVQDVFVCLWQNRQMIKNTDSLKPFLFTISRNLLISACRKRANMPVIENLKTCIDKAEIGTERPMEYDELRQAVNSALGKLPARQREIIVLSRLNGLKNKEIAQRLNLSEQTVKNQLSLGLKAVRGMLKNVPIVIIELMMLFL